jgi:hypothetical protein
MQKITFDLLRSVDSATFTGTYVPVGTPLTFPVSILKFVNNSSVLVTVSIDGVNGYDVLPATSYSVYDEGTNHANDHVWMSKGTQFYVNGTVGTGLFYVVCQYIIPNPSITGL